MGEFNLPPGCSASDIPGNSDQDAEWEKLFDDLGSMGISPHDIRERVNNHPKAIVQLEKVRRLIKVYGLPEFGTKEWDQVQAKAFGLIKAFKAVINSY